MEDVVSEKAAAYINLDRISQFPEPIIQQILSLLNSKESARTSLLSKSLFNAWSTRSVLDFDIANLDDNFMQCLLKSLQFYHKERLPLQKFKLHIQGSEDEEARQRNFDTAQDWFFSVIKLALCNGIVELDLSTNYLGLPFQHKDLEWCNLEKLKLEYLPIDDHTLSYMISSFPLLTHLHLEGCQGLNKIHALKIPNLREFYLICTKTHWMEEVDISAPKLESFRSTNVRVVHIDEGTSLKSLSISDSTMEQVRIQGLLSRCPFLEDLSLNWCKKIKTLVVSSHSIKFLKLNECWSLDTIDIDAPNLQLLEYICRYRVNRLPFVISRAARKGQFCSITYCCENDSAEDQSSALRQLMTNFPSSTLTVQSLSYHSWPTVDEKLYYDTIALQPVDEHQLESLTLQYGDINQAEMEGFLQMCHPKNVTCEYLDVYENHIIMSELCFDLWRINKHAGEILQFGGCRSQFHCRCWRHYVKEARICNGFGDEYKPLIDCESVSLLTATNYEVVSLSKGTLIGQAKISFALDWK